jgi:transcriptional regulator GlxA family with amidase domain
MRFGGHDKNPAEPAKPETDRNRDFSRRSTSGCYRSTAGICIGQRHPHAGRIAPGFLTKVVARASRVISSAGLGLLTHRLSREDSAPDTLIVTGGAGIEAACKDRRLVGWIARRARTARRVASVCSGSFLLGVAGLLNRKRVVTHWHACDRLAKRYPQARVESDPIFIQDGNLWSSAGVTAGIDLALAMVEEDLGHATAMAVARELVVFLKRPGGQAQFSVALNFQTRDSGFESLHGWMADHLAADLTVSELSRRAGMTERSFVRHYRRAIGITPARAVDKLRVEEARAQLVGSAEPVKRIAERCGFGSEDTMRRTFLREVEITPRDYRERFSPKRKTSRAK